MLRSNIACAFALSVCACSTMPSTSFDSALARCAELSKDPLEPAQITFSNTSHELLSLSWVNPLTQGLIHYKDIAPGDSYVQATYVGHLWLAKSPSGKVTTMFCTRSSSASVDLAIPSPS